MKFNALREFPKSEHTSYLKAFLPEKKDHLHAKSTLKCDIFSTVLFRMKAAQRGRILKSIKRHPVVQLAAPP